MNASPLTRKVFTTILAIILISRVAQQCAVAIRDLTRVSIKKAAGRRDCHVSIIHTDMFVNVDSPLASVARGDTRSHGRGTRKRLPPPPPRRSFATGLSPREMPFVVVPPRFLSSEAASLRPSLHSRQRQSLACNNAS